MSKKYYLSGTHVNLKSVNRSANKQNKTGVVVRGHFRKQGRSRVYVETHRRNALKTQTVKTTAKRRVATKHNAPKRVYVRKQTGPKPWSKFEKALLLVAFVACGFGMIHHVVSASNEPVEAVPQVPDTMQIEEETEEEAKPEAEAVKTEEVEVKQEQTKTPEQWLEEERQAIVAKIHTNCAQYVPIVQKYDWDHKLAVAVMVGESNSCNPNAANRSSTENHTKWCGRYGSFGLWQLATCWADYFQLAESDLFNPELNIELAYKIYKRSGGSFSQWGAYSNGSYKKWLAS